MGRQTLKGRITESKTVAWLYRQDVYNKYGRNIVGRVTSVLPEIGAVVVILNLLFGIDTEENKVLLSISFVVFMVLLNVSGYVYWKLGLLKSERSAHTNLDPIEKDKWEAAKIILGKEHDK